MVRIKYRQCPVRVTRVRVLTWHMLCCMVGSTKSAKGVALGAKLRQLREDRKVSQRKLAEDIGIKDSGTISRWETGDRPPKAADVARVLGALGIDGEEGADVMELATGTDEPAWLAITLPERRQQLGALLNAERTATKVTHLAPLLIPGVLQTSDVIRLIMIDGGAPANEIDERVAVRIGRRDLITRRNPAHLDVLLGEAAIRTVLGGREMMIEQLRYLLELGEYPNVDLRVVPFEAGWTQLTAGAFILFDSDEAPSIVLVDMQRSALILHEADDVEVHRQAAEAVREKAMTPEVTAEFIAKVLTEMENTV